MSAKFKRGDLVRIIDPNQEQFSQILDNLAKYTGQCGEIIKYHGKYFGIYNEKIHLVFDAWEVLTPDNITLYVNENCLVLIPGDSDGRKLVNWNDCPWVPGKKTPIKVNYPEQVV